MLRGRANGSAPATRLYHPMNTRCIALLLLLVVVACEPKKQLATDEKPSAPVPVAQARPQPATAAAAGLPTDTGAAVENVPASRLRVIRANFQRLNAVRRWDKVLKRERYNSTEGGEAAYYYLAGRLAKVEAWDFGETGKWLAEYYLQPDGQLSFVYEKAYSYNRPFYYDSATARQVGDKEEFDQDESRVEETRSYFQLNRLIQQSGGSATTDKARQAEQKRLLADFNELLGLLNQPR